MEDLLVEKETGKMALMRRSCGQAIIEFTLLLPIILIVVGGLTDLGLALYVSVGTQNAVREGARVASYTPSLGADDGNVIAVVTSRIPNISQFPASELTVSNNAPSSMSACSGQQSVTVTATGTYYFAFLKYIKFDTMSISRSATMRYERTDLCTA